MVFASSPAKVILCGEHYVVYGAPAIALPVDRRNSVEVVLAGNEGMLIIKSPFGNAIIRNDGRFEGNRVLEFCKSVYMQLASGREETFLARIMLGGAPKGMGNSASIASSLACGLSALLEKKLTLKGLFTVTQNAENVAHGGKASGIDARTVIAGKPQLFKKSFNPIKFHFRSIKLFLPRNTLLVAVSTYKKERQTTAELIGNFARSNGIEKKPDELTEKERRKLILPYERIYSGILKELDEYGDPKVLGELFSKNHELLRNSNVSTAEIDEALRIGLQNGAYGGKLTGAGGKGGACFLLVDKKRANSIMTALGKKGYSAFVAKLAANGTSVEKN